MSALFDSISINRLIMDNRFVRSATMDSMAIDGKVSESELKLYEELGKGDIGLIMSHGLYPTMEGKCSPGQISIASDDAIPGLQKLVNAVHRNNGKIAAQILHGGWMCRPEVTGMQPAGPSETTHPRSGLQVRELSHDEILALVDSYVQAVKRIVQAGFDGVQLHGAHSWILSAFLSPVTNKRDDEWGGTVEKRTNLLRRICEGMRKAAGTDFPIMVKLGIKDYHPEGKNIADGVRQAQLLEVSGVDAIEVSEGMEQDFFHHIRPDVISPYYLEECAEVKKALSIPVMLVGGVRSLKDMQNIINQKIADAVSMCRPFIMNPYLVKELRDSGCEPECTSCNGCMGTMGEEKLRCVIK